MILADTVGRNRVFNSLICLFFITVVICLIKNIMSAYRLSPWTLKSVFIQRAFLNSTKHVAWPGWSWFNTSSTSINFTGFEGLPHIFHPRFSSCGNVWILWDYYMCPLQWSATSLWHLARVFRQLWPNSELLLWPAYLTFDASLQQTSSSTTLCLWAQSGLCCVCTFSAWGSWKASEQLWAFSMKQRSDCLLKYIAAELGQDGAEEENGVSWQFLYKKTKTPSNVLKAFLLFRSPYS